MRNAGMQKSSFVPAMVFAVAFLVSGAAGAKGDVGFWLAPRSNTIINQQVANEIGPHAGMIVLRGTRNNPDPAYTFPAVVSRLKRAAPDAPVLSYAWATRRAEQGRIEADLMRDVPTGTAVTTLEDSPEGRLQFLDMTNGEVRRNIVSRLAQERAQLGVDGYAIDLATRTPTRRPAPLAVICKSRADFCPNYAKGMDDVFASLRSSLGPKAVLAYNGLMTFDVNSLADQARLLEHADVAAVEYFGMDPSQLKKKSAFSADILPYLRVIPGLPAGRRVMVFGRGPWTYTDYATDYQWQRYVYGAFLLMKRPGDLFKYHASFQIPAHRGRSGGLDVYSDWGVNLGDPRGPFQIDGGIYRRDFARGEVIVAPDDGRGGAVRLSRTRYTPEGDTVSGQVRLGAGEALILLDQRGELRPAVQTYTANALSAFGWPNAKLVRQPGERLVLNASAAQAAGQNDLLLDFERSLAPYSTLEVDARLTDASAEILAVAEVDDSRGQQMWIVARVGRGGGQGASMQEAIQFGVPPRKAKEEIWPVIGVAAGQGGKVVLSGPDVVRNTEYQFRRWTHMRFVGAVDIGQVTLSQPIRVGAR